MSSDGLETKSKTFYWLLSEGDSTVAFGFASGKRTLSVCQSECQSDCMSRAGPRSYWSIESAMLPLCSISTGPSLRGSLRGRSPLIA